LERKKKEQGKLGAMYTVRRFIICAMKQIKGIRWTERACYKVRMKNAFKIRVGNFEEKNTK